MKKLLMSALIACTLLTSACANLRLTVRNERSTAVKEVAVTAGDKSYVVPVLEPGASDLHEVKVSQAGALRVNFQSEKGGLFYTASTAKLAKGDGRQLVLRLTEAGDLITDEKK